MLIPSLLSTCGLASQAFELLADRSRFSALSVFPGLAELPVPVDSSLFGLVAILGVIAGLSIGLVYRHLHSQLEEVRARAGNAEAELRMLLTVTDDAVLVLDARGTIRAVNP